MSRRNYAEGIVKELGAEMGLPDVVFGEAGATSLTFDDILVTFGYVEAPLEQLSIYVDLGEVRPGPANANFLAELNLQAWLRQCMTVGIDPAGERVLGWNVVPIGALTVGSLRAVLHLMLEAALGIRKALAHPELAGAAAHAEPGSSGLPRLGPHHIRV